MIDKVKGVPVSFTTEEGFVYFFSNLKYIEKIEYPLTQNNEYIFHFSKTNNICKTTSKKEYEEIFEAKAMFDLKKESANNIQDYIDTKLSIVITKLNIEKDKRFQKLKEENLKLNIELKKTIKNIKEVDLKEQTIVLKNLQNIVDKLSFLI